MTIEQRYLKRLELAKETNAPTGAGSFRPGSILLIGEQAANPSTSPEQQPFCCSHGCSGWLNKLLEEANIPEEKLFWINALNNDGSVVDLQELKNQLHPKAIIALGKIAQKHLIGRGISHEQIPHPQYWKRFHYKKPYPLIGLLRSLVEA